MSNLRSDCRDLIKDLPAGDIWKAHIERLCYQIDEVEERWHTANQRLRDVRIKLEEAVCTEGCDSGVVILSRDGPCHTETHNGKKFQVYDHEYFSPLGDALMAAWKMASVVS